MFIKNTFLTKQTFCSLIQESKQIDAIHGTFLFFHIFSIGIFSLNIQKNVMAYEWDVACMYCSLKAL